MPIKRNKKMATKQVTCSRRKILCQELYQYCLTPNDQFKFETTFTKIFEIIDQINEEEKNILFCVTKDRTDLDFENFIKFLSDNKCETKNILKIIKNDEKDFSIIADKSLTKGDLVFSVPENLILTVNSLGSTKLKELTKQDKMLSSMPNVALAMSVLYVKQNIEQNTELSKWSSYMNILPSEFNTPLYFSLDEIKSLKNSQSFRGIFKFLYKKFFNTITLNRNFFKTKLPVPIAVVTIANRVGHFERESILPSNVNCGMRTDLITVYNRAFFTLNFDMGVI
ncbi:histone-lysine N-methyltransferase setd3-like [Brachionus plicatilis]|uniref:Histone-lysine N-methyltransferase setd3-like n=1 Tax=Brachionus plicatilis TaxID=10195 RepID=A0A3M7S727_BRAPC|nr:histone-lysine N-methyltransferase setd3-like [Brachionus plicatilis]